MISRIQITPTVCHGKPTIEGTRVLVSTVLGALAAGDTVETILEDYPNLNADDIQAALELGSDLSRFEEHAYDEAAS
jgi:uncharacterized protein (DUF433 family)